MTTVAWREATTVLALLASAAVRAPDSEALVCGSVRLTYRDYRRAVAGFAAELRRLGAAGERVALLCGNSIEAAVATLAIQAAGAVFCPLNHACTERELRQIVSDCRPRLAICDATCAPLVRVLAAETGIAHVLALEGATDAWVAQWGAAPMNLPPPIALGMIQYTGGTTGRPKGVMLTHRSIAINVA